MMQTQTAERDTVKTLYGLETQSFSNNLRSEIDSRLTSTTVTKSKFNRFFYSVGAFNILLEQEIKVENLSDLIINIIPHAPEWCEGIVNIRGVITPIANMHTFLKTGIKKSSKETELIMLDHKGHAPIIFRIDKLPEMIYLDDYIHTVMPDTSPSWLIKALKNGASTLYEINHSDLMKQLKNTQL